VVAFESSESVWNSKLVVWSELVILLVLQFSIMSNKKEEKATPLKLSPFLACLLPDEFIVCTE
jgi:hypothetical protein